MNRSFIISKLANRDIESIADYLAENRGFESSDRFIKGLTDRLTQLTQFPNIGRRRDEIFPGVRSLLYEKYLIFYTVTDEVVEINRVANGHQDLNQFFQR